MKIRIRVRKSDINNGKRYSSYSCPIALAVKRCWRKDIIVGTIAIYKNSGNIYGRNKVLCLNSVSVSRKITAFDRGELLKPFSFIINI